jgi:hypothetical protein
MSEYDLSTPVAMFVFNRPDETQQVFDRVSEAEPPALYVVSDGPRTEVPDEAALVKEVREIATEVDWDCELHTDFASSNLGVKERIASGISWVLDETEEAIFLEDDCLPHLDFFRFCEEMLEMYRGDERVMDVTGTNVQRHWKDDRQDYHFTNLGIIWGWATWAEMWEEYDPKMSLWGDPEVRERVRDVLADDSQYRFLEREYRETYTGSKDTWDYQWSFARQRNSGLSVVPSRNLVTNIGFGSGTFHDEAEDDPRADLPTFEMDFPVERNPYVAPDREYDRQYHDMRAPFWYDSEVLTRLRDVVVSTLDSVNA